MLWSALFDAAHKPTIDQIVNFVATPLWEDLTSQLQRDYGAAPALFYSGCSMEGGAYKGWNVKCKKGGRTLCTLYPKRGYFVALIPVGRRESEEAELLLPLCTPYTQDLYSRTKPAARGGKSLPVAVTDQSILHDVKGLVALRAGSPKPKERAQP